VDLTSLRNSNPNNTWTISFADNSPGAEILLSPESRYYRRPEPENVPWEYLPAFFWSPPFRGMNGCEASFTSTQPVSSRTGAKTCQIKIEGIPVRAVAVFLCCFSDHEDILADF